ncbi:MAG: hypothetical protein HYT76_05865 [Deltaproteobacteria bacterium]|nr:hypothetical protein [Deltaproteobacteria bacterium]
MTLLRWSAAVGVLLVGVFLVSYMQRKFDEGDSRRALAVIQGNFPDVHDCNAEVVSRFRGHVRVRCYRGEDQTEEWLVDLVHSTIGGSDHGD